MCALKSVVDTMVWMAPPVCFWEGIVAFGVET
jgi:hypothetical protein